MKKIFISLFALALLCVPAIVSAQVGGPRPNFNYTNDLVDQIVIWAQRGITFLMVLATGWFIWTVITYIRSKDSKDAEEKKAAMIRGIIGLFVIVGIWGIIRIISSTLGVTGGSAAVPCPPGLEYDTVLKVCK
jgi:uncharacterized membrane protein YfcA